MKNPISNFWEMRSKTYGRSLSGVLFKSFPPQLNEYLDKWMYGEIKSELKGKNLKILDLGCGYGRLSSKILDDFSDASLFGIDISKHYIDLYNEDLSPRGVGIQGDLVKLPFKDNTFDVAFSVTTLMYITDLKDQKIALKEVFRVLKKGGLFVFIERNEQAYNAINLWGLVPFIRGKKNREIKAVSYNIKNLSAMIAKAGGVVSDKRGLTFWTVFLPLLFFISKINVFLGRLSLRVVQNLDYRFTKLLFGSLYISYKGYKK